MKFLKPRKVITLLAVSVAISGFFYRESFASTSNPTTKAECEINDDRYCSFTCLGGGWKSIGTCSDDNNAKCCSREVSDVACNSTDCGNGVKGVCKPECDSGSEKQSGTCASTSSSSKCCVPASCTPTNTTPSTNTDSGTTTSGTASLNYTPLENLPGFEGQSGDFATYFGNLYKLALWIVAISALFMLVVGGFLYLSSAGNTSLLGTAKKTIYSALIGLVIALISWLLLDTINSDLTNLKLTGLTGAIGANSSTSSTSATPASGDTNKSGCEALKYVTVKEQCNLASSELVKILSCMESKGITNSVFSISSSAVGGDQTKASACCNNGHTSGCPHSGVTCHHGCTYGTKGLSYAADIQTSASDSDATLCAIASAAKSCGAGNVWGARTISSCGIVYQEGHNTHLHVSVAGCAH